MTKRRLASSTVPGVQSLLLCAQSLLYVAAGVNHFWHTAFYAAIVPTHYGHPVRWVQFTGLAEIAGGIGLLPRSTRRLAAWGIVAMLLVYLDVHVFMATHPGRFARVPRWALLMRIPLQVPLLYWAWIYTRRSGVRR